MIDLISWETEPMVLYRRWPVVLVLIIWVKDCVFSWRGSADASSSCVTSITRERWQIEKWNNYENSRESYEEYYGRKISPISGPGKEILFYAKLIKISMKSIFNQKINFTTGISISGLVRMMKINDKSESTNITSLMLFV